MERNYSLYLSIILYLSRILGERGYLFYPSEILGVRGYLLNLSNILGERVIHCTGLKKLKIIKIRI